MPLEPAPTDATTVATFQYPSIGGVALAFVVLLSTVGAGGLAWQAFGTGPPLLAPSIDARRGAL